MIELFEDVKKLDFDKKKVLEKIKNDVHGLVELVEMELLYVLALNSIENIVEIGSYYGRSTVCLALGLKDRLQLGDEKVYAVDPWVKVDKNKGYDEVSFDKFVDNIKKMNMKELVVPCKGTSERIVSGWDKKIGMLFIDGDHSYKTVKFDLENWTKFLVIGGFVALHDVGNLKEYPGLTRAHDEFFQNNPNFSFFTESKACFRLVVYRRIK